MPTYASILALDINRAELEQPLEEPITPLRQAQLCLLVQHLHLLLIPRGWHQRGLGGAGGGVHSRWSRTNRLASRKRFALPYRSANIRATTGRPDAWEMRNRSHKSFRGGVSSLSDSASSCRKAWYHYAAIKFLTFSTLVQVTRHSRLLSAAYGRWGDKWLTGGSTRRESPEMPRRSLHAA